MAAWLAQVWASEHPDRPIAYADVLANPPHELLGIERGAYLASLDDFRTGGGYAAMAPNPRVLAWLEANGERCHHVALTATAFRAAPSTSAWVLRHFGRWIRDVCLRARRAPGRDPAPIRRGQGRLAGPSRRDGGARRRWACEPCWPPRRRARRRSAGRSRGMARLARRTTRSPSSIAGSRRWRPHEALRLRLRGGGRCGCPPRVLPAGRRGDAPRRLARAQRPSRTRPDAPRAGRRHRRGGVRARHGQSRRGAGDHGTGRNERAHGCRGRVDRVHAGAGGLGPGQARGSDGRSRRSPVRPAGGGHRQGGQPDHQGGGAAGRSRPGSRVGGGVAARRPGRSTRACLARRAPRCAGGADRARSAEAVPGAVEGIARRRFDRRDRSSTSSKMPSDP